MRRIGDVTKAVRDVIGSMGARHGSQPAGVNAPRGWHAAMAPDRGGLVMLGRRKWERKEASKTSDNRSGRSPYETPTALSRKLLANTRTIAPAEKR